MATRSPFWRIAFLLHLFALLLAYFFAAVNPWLSPSSWPLANLVALGAPYVLAYAFLYFLILAFWQRRTAWLLLALPALLWLTNVVGLGKWKTSEEGKPLRVMSINIQSFQQLFEYQGYPNPQRKAFEQFVAAENPDLICFQEFTESGEPFLQSNLALVKKMGYPHIAFPVDSVQMYGQFSINYGTLVASKFPIAGARLRRFRPTQPMGEGVTHVQVQSPAGLLHVLNLHLSSMSLGVPRDDSRGISNLKRLASDVKTSRSEIFRRIIQFSYLHEQEAEMVRQLADSLPQERLLICGDLNNVANSYAYRTIKGSRKDAFARAGRGLGKSYKTGLPTIRIDYVFCGSGLNPQNHRSLATAFSDHFAQVVDFRVN